MICRAEGQEGGAYFPGAHNGEAAWLDETLTRDPTIGTATQRRRYYPSQKEPQKKCQCG